MAVYVFCPNCKTRISLKETCNKCGAALRGKPLSYTIEYWIAGNRIRESIGKVSRDTALRIERKRRTEVAEGRYARKDKTPLLAEVFDNYIEEKLSGHWAIEVRFFLDLMITEWPGIRTDMLTVQMTRAYRKKLVDAGGRKPNTVDRHIACAKAAWNYAGLALKNPFCLKPFNPKPSPPRIPTAIQEKSLMKLLEKEYPVIYEMVIVSICTGLRQREIYNLKWSELDLERGYAYVRGKGDKPHVVRLNELAMDTLNRIQKNGYAYVWINPSTGRPLTTLKTAWKSIRTKAKLPDGFRWHDLRHVAASKLINAGASLHAVQKFLNHSDPRTTEQYAHLMPGYLDSLVEKIEICGTGPKTGPVAEDEEKGQ